MAERRGGDAKSAGFRVRMRKPPGNPDFGGWWCRAPKRRICDEHPEHPEEGGGFEPRGGKHVGSGDAFKPGGEHLGGVLELRGGEHLGGGVFFEA